LGITLKGDIDRFVYRQGESSYRFGGVEIDADIRNITSGAMDDLLDAEISIQSDSLYRISGSEISLPSVDLSFHEGQLRVRGDAMINGDYSVGVDGTVNVVANEGY